MLLFDQTARHRLLRPGPRRRPDPVAAPVLVLRPPRGLRRAAAGDGHRGRDHDGVRAQEAVRLQDGHLHGHRHRRAVSFFVWAHHQFIAGIDPRMANVFTVTTLLISIPIAEMMFVYIATLYGGSIRLTTPMLWALGVHRRVPDRRRHRHLPRARAARTSTSTTRTSCSRTSTTRSSRSRSSARSPGITYWFPKMFGRMMNETLGKIHFWGTIIPFNFIFIPLFITGLGRRAPPHLRLHALPRAGDARAAGAAHRRDGRAAWSCSLFQLDLPLQLHLQHVQAARRPAKNPWKREHARVDGRLAAAARQLRRSCRPSTAARTSTASRAARTTTGPSTSRA